MDPLKGSDIDAALREISKRSLSDAEFRRLALTDGGAAFAQVAAGPLPHGLTISFVSNHGKLHKSIVLPDPVANADTISAEELEQVAGGMQACGISTCGTST